MLDIIIATGNAHKLRELELLLKAPGVRWHSLAEVENPPSVIENGRSFDANALKKARALAKATGWLALADDSGIEVDALGGAPGIRSARFAGTHGDDAANNAKLLRLLEGKPLRQRKARYRCSLALATPEGKGVVVQGVWEGHIALKPIGSGGFGYDPLFWLGKHGKTAGQIPDRLKQQISHRADAAAKLKPLIRSLAKLNAELIASGLAASVAPPADSVD